MYQDDVNGQGIFYDVDNTTHENILGIFKKSFFEKQNECPIEISKIQLVSNPALEKDFGNKRMGIFKITGELPEETYGFVVEEQPDVVKEVCSNGMWTAESFYNVLGASKFGVYVGKHPDIGIQHMLSKNPYLKIFYIIMFKIVARTTKAVVRSELGVTPIVPTKNFDCHLSLFQPKPNDSIQDKFNKSQLYLYEIDPRTSAYSARPRHLLPYAILEVVQIQNLVKHVYVPTPAAEVHNENPKLAQNPQLANIVARINSKGKGNTPMLDDMHMSSTQPAVNTFVDTDDGDYPGQVNNRKQLQNNPGLMNLINSINKRLYTGEEDMSMQTMGKVPRHLDTEGADYTNYMDFERRPQRGVKSFGQMDSNRDPQQRGYMSTGVGHPSQSRFDQGYDMKQVQGMQQSNFGQNPHMMQQKQQQQYMMQQKQQQQYMMQQKQQQQQSRFYQNQDMSEWSDASEMSDIDLYLEKVREKALMRKRMGLDPFDALKEVSAGGDACYPSESAMGKDYLGGYIGSRSAERDMYENSLMNSTQDMHHNEFQETQMRRQNSTGSMRNTLQMKQMGGQTGMMGMEAPLRTRQTGEMWRSGVNNVRQNMDHLVRSEMIEYNYMNRPYNDQRSRAMSSGSQHRMY